MLMNYLFITLYTSNLSPNYNSGIDNCDLIAGTKEQLKKCTFIIIFIHHYQEQLHMCRLMCFCVQNQST